MAEVFEGYDTRLGRTVAIKLLKSDLANDASFEAKFRQEAQASARMAHPTIVRVYDAGEEETLDENGSVRKTPYIVMEFVKGTLLRQLIHDGEIELTRSVKFVNGILTALEVSHRAGVVHRDIKPANVMIGDSDSVKVMDFGIARAVSDNSATQAATGGIIGTAQYFSPEQARGDAVDGRTDLYSTGVILYELLAGRPPFQGESAVSVAYQHVSEVAELPSKFNPQISPELDAVVMRAMAKDRDERFQNAEEFREHLNAAIAGTQSSAPLIPLGQPGTSSDATELISRPQLLNTSPTSLLEGFETVPNEKISTASTNKVGSGVIWGLGTGVAVILIGLLFWVLNLGNGNPPINPEIGIQVLNVEGSLYEDAFNTLSAQDLLVLRVYEKSESVPEGVVIRQEPPAGTSVLSKTPVTVYVSSGATEVAVPNVVGRTEADAVLQIEAQGLVVGTITPVGSATVPEGTVVASDPVTNQKLPVGSVVNLVLSDGTVSVPDVRNLDVLEARSIMTSPSIGFTVSVEIRDGDTCTGSPGTVVLQQSILPGDAKQKQNIVLYVECVGNSTPTETPTASPTVTPGG